MAKIDIFEGLDVDENTHPPMSYEKLSLLAVAIEVEIDYLMAAAKVMPTPTRGHVLLADGLLSMCKALQDFIANVMSSSAVVYKRAGLETNVDPDAMRQRAQDIRDIQRAAMIDTTKATETTTKGQN